MRVRVSAMCMGVRLTQLEQPALEVGVEEGVSEVIAVVLRDGEGLTLDAVEEVLRGRSRERLGCAVHPSPGPGPLLAPLRVVPPLCWRSKLG